MCRESSRAGPGVGPHTLRAVTPARDYVGRSPREFNEAEGKKPHSITLQRLLASPQNTKGSPPVALMLLIPGCCLPLQALSAPGVIPANEGVRGRRPLLLIGFCVLPIRSVLFAFFTSPTLFIVAQVLDGLSGATLGVLTALIIADLTTRTGRFNLAQGLVGTFPAATKSTAGWSRT